MALRFVVGPQGRAFSQRPDLPLAASHSVTWALVSTEPTSRRRPADRAAAIRITATSHRRLPTGKY